MNSPGTFPFKAEVKDHRPLNDVHFLSIHFLNMQNFGQLLAIVSLFWESPLNSMKTSTIVALMLDSIWLSPGVGEGGNISRPPDRDAIPTKDEDWRLHIISYSHSDEVIQVIQMSLR
jgi:hypothetical protein